MDFKVDAPFGITCADIDAYRKQQHNPANDSIRDTSKESFHQILMSKEASLENAGLIKKEILEIFK